MPLLILYKIFFFSFFFLIKQHFGEFWLIIHERCQGALIKQALRKQST